MIKLLLADDHTMFTDGMQVLLSQRNDMEVVGSAANGLELMEKLLLHKADIVLLDINMPGMNGIEACALIKKRFPAIRVIIISMYKTKEFIQSLYRIGANGYLLKNTGGEELVNAIQTVYQGGTYFSEEVAQTVLEEQKNKSAWADKPAVLSAREIEIVRQIAIGLNNDEIADKLFISQHTVKTHRKKILQKLELSNTAELIKYASQLGILGDQ